MHLAFILDGNRRWARREGLPSIEGHRRGLLAARDQIIEACLEKGVAVLSLYTFSTENWKRTPLEIHGLMTLFEEMIDSQVDAYMQQGVRVRHIGRKDRLPKKVLQKLAAAEEKTKDNSRLTICLAMDYGGRDEIARAVSHIFDTKDVTPALIEEHLDTAGLPSVDLLIRTGGEQRLSNFLIWQAAYAELKFLNKFLPELTKDDVIACIEEYQDRERRFGK